jgi:hypothetical protein
MSLEGIQQFYRLALLMHSDAIAQGKRGLIKQIAIRMGLNPEAAKRVLKK